MTAVVLLIARERVFGVTKFTSVAIVATLFATAALAAQQPTTPDPLPSSFPSNNLTNGHQISYVIQEESQPAVSNDTQSQVANDQPAEAQFGQPQATRDDDYIWDNETLPDWLEESGLDEYDLETTLAADPTCQW